MTALGRLAVLTALGRLAVLTLRRGAVLAWRRSAILTWRRLLAVTLLWGCAVLATGSTIAARSGVVGLLVLGIVAAVDGAEKELDDP
jgi:hypothetical protein